MLTTIRATARRSITTYASQFGAVDVPNASFTQFVADKVAAHDPAKAMLTCGLSGKTLTFGEFAPRVAAAAAKLEVAPRDGPFGAGSKLLIHAPNCVEFPVAFPAALALGGVVSTSNPLYTARELAHQVKDADASHVLTVGPFESVVAEAVELAGGKATVSVLGDGDFVDFAGFDAAAAPAPDFSLDGAARTAVGGAAVPSSEPFDAAKTLAALPYSSGTTGLAKGVMLTHGNIVANLIQTVAMVERARPDLCTRDDTLLGLLPMFHIYGMITILHFSMIYGTTLVTLPNFEPESFLKTIAQHQVSVAHLVPPLILFLAKHPAKEAAERIGASVLQGYGMTETSPVLTMDDGDHFAGKLIPSTEAALMVPDGESYRDAALGEEGELWCRGPQVMPGYLNRPDANAEATDDGFVKTGDVAKIDADGNLFIVDRVKELIKVKGLQVAPAELEGLLLLHPAVADAAVVGEPDDRAGEKPHAFVVLKLDADASAIDLTNFVAEKVAVYKQIQAVTFVDEIPKSASGKILRRVLAGE
ncbi:ligase [Aureococcus anophagefferens]|nr:ligase [Aureococcus anophagefferens]